MSPINLSNYHNNSSYINHRYINQPRQQVSLSYFSILNHSLSLHLFSCMPFFYHMSLLSHSTSNLHIHAKYSIIQAYSFYFIISSNQHPMNFISIFRNFSMAYKRKIQFAALLLSYTSLKWISQIILFSLFWTAFSASFPMFSVLICLPFILFQIFFHTWSICLFCTIFILLTNIHYTISFNFT